MTIDAGALTMATIAGTVAQVAMVVMGHSNKKIASLFAVGGMGLSLIAGLAYTIMASSSQTLGSALAGGAVAGGVCALIGIFVSYMLKDVPAPLLAFGTLSSAVTGAIGGWLGTVLR